MANFLHGVEVVTVDDGPRPVQTVRSAVIGLVGTAPDANEDDFPLNTPVLVNSRGGYSGVGAAGTLKPSLDGIFAQYGAFVVVIRVEEGADDDESMDNVLGGVDVGTGARTGLQAFRDAQTALGLTPMLLIAPGFTSERPTGVDVITVSNPGTGYTSAPTVGITSGGGEGASATAVLTNGVSITLGDGGTGYTTAPTVVIAPPPAGGVQATATATLTGNAVTAINVTNPGKGYTSAPAVSFTGGGGTGATATAALTGRVGSILITNHGRDYTSAATVGFTGGGGGTGAAATATIGSTPNPVVSALLTMAEQFRAHVIADGPSTTDGAAINYRNDFGSRRLYIVDPKVKVYDADANGYVARPGSPHVAGVIAKTDAEQGFWKSPSNELVNGIGGTERPIDYAVGDPNTRANLLNENEVATFIRDEGWRVWGNRTASADAKWAFLPVSRTADMIDLSVMKGHRWAVDKPITRGYLDSVVASVNGYLRQLQSRGAILGGRCWVDPDLNTAADYTAGNVTFSYDFTPVSTAERVTFHSRMTDAYVTALFDL